MNVRIGTRKTRASGTLRIGTELRAVKVDTHPALSAHHIDKVSLRAA